MNTIKDRLNIIAIESKAILKPLIGIAAIIGGGLIPFMQYIWKPASAVNMTLYLISVLITVFLLVLCWSLSSRISNLYWYDREYQLLKNEWIYTVSEDGTTLDGECIAERNFICLDGDIEHFNVSIDKDESFVPFDPAQNYHQELISYERDCGGSVTMLPPHKNEGSSFAFKIRFEPPLTKNESIRMKYRYKIPKFKIANLEYLRDKMTTARVTTRDYEYNSFKVLFPVRKFVYIVKFDKKCGVSPLGVEVRRGTSSFPSEQRNLADNKFFRVENDALGCRMILERCNPPMKAGYRIKWKPPTRENLNKT